MMEVIFKAQHDGRDVGIRAMQLTEPDDDGKFWIDLPAAPPIINQSCLQHVTVDMLVQQATSTQEETQHA